MGALFELYRAVYRGLERIGVHLTPVHYHFPLPDTGRIPEAVWGEAKDSPGVDFQDASQIELLRTLSQGYREEYARFPGSPVGGELGFHLENGHFEGVDAEILYSLVRDRRPRRFFEVGSGFSTLLALQAAAANAAQDHPCAVTVFDPHPGTVLERHDRAHHPRPAGTLVSFTLHRERVERVPLETFQELQSGDMLFIDSSHVLTVGNDVHRLFLHVIPRLRPGVLVHVHDIFLPAEYPRYWVKQRLRFWNEQYLLQAFLAFNASYRVLWGSHYMALRHPDILAAAIPSYTAHRWPGSFWFTRVS